MQLFVAAYGLAGDLEGRLRGALDAGAQPYPSLSDEPTVVMTGRGRLSVAAKAHGPSVAAPRRYLARRGAEAVLYDGLPIARDAEVAGHDADQLLAGWPAIGESLTGIYSAIHADLENETLECVIDPLGLCQVFAWEEPGRWVIGNSIDALKTLIPELRPDPLGVGSLLTLGWPIDGRTLIEGLSALPGGQIHRWTGADRGSRALCTPALVAPRTLRSSRARRPSVPSEWKNAIREISRCGPIRCGVTAGRDSRVVLSLLKAANVNGCCYTVGRRGHPDVEAGRELASLVGFDHHIWNPRLPRDADWSELTSRFVSQTNGLANIAGIADWIDNQREPDPLAVKLWGIGGEIGRGALGLATAAASNAPWLRSSVSVQRRVLTKNISVAGGLVSDECAAVTRDALRRFIDSRRAEGWRTGEVLEAAYAFERVSHWAAAGVRRASETTDVFSPFVTADFLEFAFSMTSGGRFVEAPHRMLLEALAPELRGVPFDRPWRPRYPRMAPVLVSVEAARAAAKRLSSTARSSLAGNRAAAGPGLTLSGRWFDQFGHAWLEAGVPQVRDAMLSRADSPIWDYVDRLKLEKLLAAGSEVRHAHLDALCGVVTAFWHLHAEVDPRPATNGSAERSLRASIDHLPTATSG